MTVANLIALLKQMPQKSTVAVQNSDGIFQYITTAKQSIIISTRAGGGALSMTDQPGDVKTELVVLK